MVSSINSIGQITYQPQIYQRQAFKTDATEPLTSFDDEDEAIISTEAKMLNELEKFNSGAGNIVELAVASEMAKFTASAMVNVVNAKQDMIDCVLEMGETDS